jgi:cobaltochelatase CobT
MMAGFAKKRRSANPQALLRNLAGLKPGAPVGFLPAVPHNPAAERALYDLRAFALRSLDTEFLTAIRPLQPEPALMLDAGIDAIGYAAFVLSRLQHEYAGVHNNLDALHGLLLGTAPRPEIINFDLQAFLIVLSAAREILPALAAKTAALEPLLTEAKIFAIPGRRPPEYAKLIRRIYGRRAQFAKFFGGTNELNEVVARFFPLLHQEPDETVFSYSQMKERIRAARENLQREQPETTRKSKSNSSGRISKKQHVPGRKRRAPPNVAYYGAPSDAVTDRTTRGQASSMRTVPGFIKDLYWEHGRELAREQKAWLRLARETRAAKSSMRWIPSENGTRIGNLAQKIINPFDAPQAQALIEEAQEERKTIATILVNLSCSMENGGRDALAYMIADRFGDLLTKGEIPTEILGHTTTGDVIENVIRRNRPIHYVIFKTRREPHNLSTVHRLCSIFDTQMHYFSYDGEAILKCCDEIKKSAAEQRIVFVVTDGGPPSGSFISKRGNDIGYFSTRHYRDVVAHIEAEENVVIVGVSIGEDVSDIFSRSVRIDSVQDIYEKLSPYALAMMRNLNEQKRPSSLPRLRGWRRAEKPGPSLPGEDAC